MGLVHPDLATSASEGARPAELGSRVIAKGLAALPSQECFSGLAAKSREIRVRPVLLNRVGSFPGAPAATSTALAVPAPAAATAAQGPRRNKTPRAEPPSRAVHEVAYLAGGSYVAAGLSVLAKARSRDRVFLRAYSFDAPRVLEALEAACARGAACSLVADASQCAKTKHQWQSLKRVAAAGVNVRLAAGQLEMRTWRTAGAQRSVGAGLKGLHHSKALLVVSETTADLIVGSLNWSTSSKANAESGLHLAVASGAPVVADFIVG